MHDSNIIDADYDIIEDDNFFADFLEKPSDATPSTSLTLISEKREHDPFGLSLNDSERKIVLSPALSYISSLGSPDSRTTMASLLNCTAKILNYKSIYDCPWEKLTKEIVEHVVRELRKKELAPQTINLYLNAIKQTVDHALDQDLMDIAVALRIKKIKRERGSRISKGREVKPDEIRKVLSTCKSENITSKDIRDAAMLCITRGCGLRRAELTNLKNDSLNHSTRILRVIGKGNKERTIKVPAQLFPIIKRWIDYKSNYNWKKEETEWMFCRIHKHGQLQPDKLTGKGVQHIFSKRVETANIEKFAPHDLRRTFCTSLLSSGNASLNDVQLLMGHADMRTTQRYDMRNKDRLFDISDGIDIF
ncbi:tyrosine-type recombinase/integrase [Photobacterium kishitanii]|nr:tyrosine-type recombinase/integrase [Photobacterium kishitanii]